MISLILGLHKNNNNKKTKLVQKTEWQFPGGG